MCWAYLVVMEAVLTEELDEEEQLVRRHRKEKKELQGDGEWEPRRRQGPGKGAWRASSGAGSS